MTSAKTKVERRQFGRRRMTSHAWVYIGRRQPIACVVRNISRRGALLEFPDRPPTAESFRLVVEEPSIDARCEVRHRRGAAVGVYFVEAETPVVVVPTQTAASRRIVANMRQRLKKPERK